MQDARAWPEHEVQKLVEDHWKLQCRREDEDTQVDGMVGQARMIKLVRLLHVTPLRCMLVPAVVLQASCPRSAGRTALPT